MSTTYCDNCHCIIIRHEMTKKNKNDNKIKSQGVTLDFFSTKVWGIQNILDMWKNTDWHIWKFQTVG